MVCLRIGVSVLLCVRKNRRKERQPVYMVIMTMMVTGSSSLSFFLSVWAAEEQSKGLEFIIRDFPLEGTQ